MINKLCISRVIEQRIKIFNDFVFFPDQIQAVVMCVMLQCGSPNAYYLRREHCVSSERLVDCLSAQSVCCVSIASLCSPRGCVFQPSFRVTVMMPTFINGKITELLCVDALAFYQCKSSVCVELMESKVLESQRGSDVDDGGAA